MAHFKNLKSGFSFLEVMIAIVLLAIFGTSLFKVQTFIFATTTKVHHNVTALLELNKVTPEFTLKKFNTLKENKSVDQLSLQKELQQPNATISITTKPISEKSSLFKDFNHAAKIIERSILLDGKKEKISSFTFAPPLQDNKKELS